MKYIFYIFLLYSIISFAYSQTYINEINFIDNEFIEIYSDTNLNFSNLKVYDENGISKYNTLSPYQTKQSNYYLIAGSNFQSANDLSSLNCTIYLTDKSQVSNGGLKSSGENLTIQTSNSTNLSWVKDKDYSFNTDETLNFNITSNSYFLAKASPCLPFKLKSSNIPSNNQSNVSDLNSCNYYFNITLDSNIFENEIEYKFKTNASDYTIQYWIEDYEGNVVRSKTNTLNTNQKSYTPELKSEIYKIKAELTKETCKLKDSRYVFFHSNGKEESSQKNLYSKIFITNENDFKTQNDNLLRYEVYRGDTSKRTIHITQNSHLLSAFDVEKYGEIKGRIEIQLKPGKNIIRIEGLGITKEIELQGPKEETKPIIINNLPNNQTNKQYFNITNFDINQSNISFNITSNIDNLTGDCYISYSKTKVSNIFNISENTSISLQINNSQIFDKTQNQTNQLKLTCRYKKSQLKTLNYFSQEFNYTIIFPNENKDFNLNNDYYSQNNIIKDNYSKENKLSQIQNKDLLENPLINNTIQYESKSQKAKTNSVYFVLVGTVSVLGAMIFKW